jgi:hypothetical protein
MGELQHYLYLLGMARPGPPGTGRREIVGSRRVAKRATTGRAAERRVVATHYIDQFLPPGITT